MRKISLLNKKGVIITALTSTIVVCAGGIKPPSASGEYKNLQVLPTDISTVDLQRIMVDEFQDGLGVNCGYCHAQQKDGSLHLDFASDAKPEKQIARKMLSMLIEINKNYFGIDSALSRNGQLSVTCITCHQRAVRPPQ